MKIFILYLLRWQLSTFILAPVMHLLKNKNPWIVAALANLIGGSIFFFVDRYLFTGGI